MDRSGSQKLLRVWSIIGIIFGILGLILGVLAIVGSSFMNALPAADMAELDEILADTDINSGEFAALVGIEGLVILFTGIISIVEGWLGLRAAADASKIMPVWYLSLVGIAVAVIGLITSIMNGGFDQEALGMVSHVIISGFIFWLANNIKIQAGK